MSKEKHGEKASATGKKEIVPARPRQRLESTIAPYRPTEFRANFNRIFETFRRDFEDLLWPSERFFEMEVPMMRELETRMPTMDLEDLGKEYHLTLEVPGLKKEDIEIQISDDSVEIRGNKSSRHDEKTKGYIQKERSAESFYRTVTLPEDIKTDDAEACLNDGVLEIKLPKKVPKTKKKLSVK